MEDLFAVLNKPTEKKGEEYQEFSGLDGNNIDYSDDFMDESEFQASKSENQELFDPEKEEIEEVEVEEVEEIEEEPKKQRKVSPEESAHTIVGLIEGLNAGVCYPLLIAKLKKKYSIKKIQQKAERALEKELAGIEMSDDELALVGRWKRYREDMDLLKGKIAFEDHEKQRLFDEAVRLADKRGIEAPAELGFGVAILQVLGKRIVDITTI